MQILSLLRFSRIGLRCGWATLLVIVLSSGMVAARETYSQYADRILANTSGEIELRPDLEAAVLRSTNAYRSSKQLPPLKPATDTLLRAARAHAMDLLLQGAMGHTSSTGYNFESRMRALHPGEMFLSPMAENAARLRNTKLSDAARAQALVQQWIESSGHRKNMVNRTYKSVAIGVVAKGNTVYAVQIFSGPVVKSNMGLFGNQN